MPTTGTSSQTAVAQLIKEQPLQMDCSVPHGQSTDSMDAKNTDGFVEDSIKGGVNDNEENGAEPVDSDSRKDKDSKSPSTADDDDIAENLHQQNRPKIP